MLSWRQRKWFLNLLVRVNESLRIYETVFTKLPIEKLTCKCKNYLQ